MNRHPMDGTVVPVITAWSQYSANMLIRSGCVLRREVDDVGVDAVVEDAALV